MINIKLVPLAKIASIRVIFMSNHFLWINALEWVIIKTQTHL